jgi:hypothetical protein
LQRIILIVAVRAFQAQAYHLSIIGPLLGSVRQPGNDPLDLFAFCRILDRSGDGFKISKKALSFVGHDTNGSVFLLFATIAVDVSPQCHEKNPAFSGWGAGSWDWGVLIGPVPPQSG